MEATNKNLLKGIKEANSQHYCDPVQFARYKMEAAAKSKNYDLYGYWSRVEDALIAEERSHDLETASDAYEFSDADNGL